MQKRGQASPDDGDALALQFEEVAQKAGLRFQLNNGESGRYRQIELMAGGVAVLDYDDDCSLDVFFTNGAEIPSLKKTGPQFHNRLFRNDCKYDIMDVVVGTDPALALRSRRGTGYYKIARIANV
jgi:hypothetical protein